jgi:hypothetical protein
VVLSPSWIRVICGEEVVATVSERSATIGAEGSDPRAAAIAFATTEHFVLQSARAATIAESTGRASMFLTSVSGGLIALGLVATAAHIGTAFYAFALVIIPTLALAGLMTFERVLQSGIEDHGYARRSSRLRAYYFDKAPELTPYLLTVPPLERLHVQGLWSGHGQRFRTVAGMMAVITAVLAGSAAGIVAALASDGSLAASLAAGLTVGLVALVALMQYQQAAWDRAGRAHLFAADEEPA